MSKRKKKQAIEEYEHEKAMKDAAKQAEHDMMNVVKNFMWQVVTEHAHNSSQQRLKEYVYDLIGMMTQKEGGQRADKPKDVLNIEAELDMTVFSIMLEAVALVLSGELNKSKGGYTAP